MRTKRIRILLFQLLCPVLFIGFSQQYVVQLHIANNAETSEFGHSAFANHHAPRTASFSIITADSELSFTEDLSEEEFEQMDTKKLDSGFLTFFSSPKPKFLLHNQTNKVAFSKRIAFYPSVKTTILYQVFRA